MIGMMIGCAALTYHGHLPVGARIARPRTANGRPYNGQCVFCQPQKM